MTRRPKGAVAPSLRSAARAIVILGTAWSTACGPRPVEADPAPPAIETATTQRAAMDAVDAAPHEEPAPVEPAPRPAFTLRRPRSAVPAPGGVAFAGSGAQDARDALRPSGSS